MRQIFIERANDWNDQSREALNDGLHDARQQGKKIRNRGSGQAADTQEIHPSEYKETVPAAHRKRSRTKNKLKLSEKIQIVHQVVCQLKPMRQVAKEHRITQGYVSIIVKKVRKNPNLLDELAASEEERHQ